MASLSLEDLKVKAGDSIKGAWKKLLRWARVFQPRQGSANVRFNMVPGQGTYVTAVLAVPTFVGAFRTSLSGTFITVGPGTISEDGVGSFTPYIGGKRVDGVGNDAVAGAQPVLTISGPPDGDLQSWIVIQAPVVQKTGQLDKARPELVKIAHVNLLEKPADQLIGQQEIALIRWKDKTTPDEVFQIALHNLKHEFLPNKKGGNTGRHFFYAQ